MSSRSGVLGGPADLIALLISPGVIGGNSMGSGYLYPSMSERSAGGGVGKKALKNTES